MTPGSRFSDLGLGPDRTAAADAVRALLDRGVRHVHVHGAPGFGKSDVIRALVGIYGPSAVAVQLAPRRALDESPFTPIYLELGGRRLDPTQQPLSWPERWTEIAALAAGSGKTLLILESVEHLFADAAAEPWPDTLLDEVQIVTVSLAPFHLIQPAVSRRDAEGISVSLLANPATETGGYEDEGRWNAQDEDGYNREGDAWRDRYAAARPRFQSSPLLEIVFKVKHRQRRDDVWDGHPLLNALLLERLLDAVAAGGRAIDAVELFRAELATLPGRDSSLHRRLLPFDADGPGAVPVSVALTIAEAVEDLAAGRRLDATSGGWLAAAGLARPGPDASSWLWTRAVTLITSEPGSEEGRDAIRRWAKRIRLLANERRRNQVLALHRSDAKFRAARDDVLDVFCERGPGARRDARLEEDRCHPIVPGLVFTFAVSQDRESLDPGRASSGGVAGERVTREILVFNTEAEGARFWSNHVRTLTMLGRARHPALPSFERGGELRAATEGDRAPGLAAPVFIEMAEYLERLSSRDVRALVADLRTPRWGEADGLARPGDDVAGGPMPAFRQVAQLAEALEIVHAQGLLHRALDFDALALRGAQATVPQLVLAGFEYSINIRQELLKTGAPPLAILHANPLKLACRPPEAPLDNPDVMDPSVDVYAFGAMAIMLMTGLPDEALLAQVDDLLPMDLNLSSGAGFAARDQLEQAARLLREDLLRPERWEGVSNPVRVLGEWLSRCLDERPAERPSMEDMAPRLRWLHNDYVASFEAEGARFRVEFPERDMGRMLKQLQLIPEDIDLEEPDGRAWLRAEIGRWLSKCRWMHYRESGFPRQGDGRAATTRLDAKFLIAGPSVVFFAAPYRPREGEDPDYSVLWLSYVMWRSEIHLPDPDDDDTMGRLATTDTITWLRAPRDMAVVEAADIKSTGKDAASWREILNELRDRSSRTDGARLGREATTVWRVHRDIQIAFNDIRNFPVKAQPVPGARGQYDLQLDEDAFTRMNVSPQNSFFRQVIIEKRDVRAFFANTISAMAEEMSGGGLNMSLYPQGRSQTRQRPIRAQVLLPLDGEIVRIRLDESDVHQSLPAYAQIVWSDTFGSRVAAERQNRAITRIERNSRLLGALVNPRDRGRLWRPLSDSCGWTLPEGVDTESLRDRVRAMLSSEPLHAMQGPPGTGKTTMIAALVAEVIQAQDGARILVTSQNHAATDNVLLSVMGGLKTFSEHPSYKGDGITPAIRIFSEQTRDNVDQDVVRRFSIDAQVQAIQKRMHESADRHAGGAFQGDSLSKAIERLRAVAAGGYLELRLKLERTAPIVFSTTGAAMTSADFIRRGAIGYYDYVLIDEAAKGWAIDLVQAMALGDRVILVGDQAQLPPFGEIELNAVLEGTEARRGDYMVPPDIDFLLDSTRFRDTGESPIARMKGWLKPFHRIFEKRPPDEDIGRLDEVPPLTQKLNRQYRSVDAIGTLVSEVFYRGSVRNAGPQPDPEHRISLRLAPDRAPAAPAVMWLDTSAIEDSKYFPSFGRGGAISNRGEADIVEALLENFEPAGRDSWERLRVLSPYKAQVFALMERFEAKADTLGIPASDLSRLFQTVDSSQGTEADTIIISLCRRRRPGDKIGVSSDEASAVQREVLHRDIRLMLGFMQQPERLNVMASRARQQLIFVGDFKHFSESGSLLDRLGELESPKGATISFWSKLISAFAPFEAERHLAPAGLEKPFILAAGQLKPQGR